MSSVASIALSGMRAAQNGLQVVAHNVANLQTPGLRRQALLRADAAEGGVVTSVGRAGVAGPALEADLVAQLEARQGFVANLAVFKTSDRMLGSLLDMHA